MADALAREYNVLPTDLLGMDLSPTSKLILNAKILQYRNNQAKVASMAESGGTQMSGKGGAKVSPAEKIRAKRMRMQQTRKQALSHYGLKE